MKKRRECYTQTVLIILSMTAILLTWSVSVAFTDVISQIANLTVLLLWLHWIDTLLMWLFNCIQDVLSQILLTALIMSQLYILHIILEHQSLLTEIAVELSLQKYYFIFLFVHIFLTVSLSLSITVIVQEVL